MAIASVSTARRAFLIRMAGGACGTAAAALLPVSLLEAREVCRLVAMPLQADACGDWQLDDMCNAYPGYAFDMRRGTSRDVPVAAVADIDLMWGA